MDPSSPEASNQAEMNGIRWKDRPTIQCSSQLKAQKEREKELSQAAWPQIGEEFKES